MVHTLPNGRPCPSPELLAAFFRGGLPEAEGDAVRAHLAACPACGATVGEPRPAQDFVAVSTAHTPATRADHSRLRERLAGATKAGPPPAGREGGAHRLGQYELFDEIGKGGMGVVFRAQHLHLKKWVAIKLLADSRLASAHAVARFEREMAVVGGLDHPNIVRATDAGCVDGFHYLAMELIDGFTLADLAGRRSDLPAREACELVRQAAVGLQYAHEHDLVHRDLKPNNLMLSDRGVLKILDLGLARLSAAGGEISWSGQVLGTPDYMAPEQWNSSRDVDIRADIYSLGCTLHTLLTKRPPFADGGCDTPLEKMAAHLQREAPSVRGLRPDVPPGVDAVLHRAMAKDRADRYQHPAEFAADLAALARGADLSDVIAEGLAAAREARAANPSAGYFRRPEGSTFDYGPGADHETHVADRPPPRRRRRLAPLLGLVTLAAAVAGVARLVAPGGADSPAPPGLADLPPEPPQLTPADLKPGVWADPLAARPTEWLWPTKVAATKSRRDWDPAKRDLWANAFGYGLLQMAEVGDADFEFEATIHQNPWVGGVGVFFARRDEADGRTGGELLYLARAQAGQARNTLPLAYSKFFTSKSHLPYQQLVSGFDVPEPVGEFRRLHLLVRRAGEIRVKWGDEPEQTVRRTRLPADTGPSPAGGVGFFVWDTAAMIREVQVRTIGPNP